MGWRAVSSMRIGDVKVDDGSASAADPWEELQSRLDGEPAGSGQVSTERAPDGVQRPREARRTRTGARLTCVLATLGSVAAMVALLVVPALERAGSPALPNPAPRRVVRQAPQLRSPGPGRSSEIGDSRAGGSVRRGKRALKASAMGGWGTQEAREAEPMAPPPSVPEAPSPPSDPHVAASPGSPPEPQETSPAPTAQPTEEAGLADGSRSSAEFGL